MTTFDKKIRTLRRHPLFGSLFGKTFEVRQILFPPNVIITGATEALAEANLPSFLPRPVDEVGRQTIGFSIACPMSMADLFTILSS
jgi:hypothetical protein